MISPLQGTVVIERDESGIESFVLESIDTIVCAIVPALASGRLY